MSEQEKNLRDYWQVLRRRRWVAITFFTVCVCTVTLGTFLMTPVYRAKTTILVEGENTNVLRAEESTTTSTNLNVYESYLETQMAIIRSQSIAGKVFEELKLDQNPRYAKKKGILKVFERKFIDDIVLERVPETRMAAINVDNPDAELAARIANRLAEVYAQDNLSRRSLTFIRNQRMGALNSEFLRLQSQYDSMSKQFGPKYPGMVELSDQIEAMARRIERERQSEPAAAQGKLSPIESALEGTLLKIQEDSVLSSSRMNNILVVDRAEVPKEIFRPRRALNILLGIGVGLIGGVLLAFFLDAMDDSIKTYEDLQRHVGDRDYLGSVFSENSKGVLKNTDVDRVMWTRSESPSAEAYRIVRTAVVWFIQKDHKIKDIAVLSTGPGEGKTTIASNLAIAISQLGKKVLLVDTDFRRGRLHESYGFSREPGLGQYLTEGISLDKIIKRTDIPNLSFVACGSSKINSSQLFSSPRMAEFIREARTNFDFVFYDTPPLAIISDTAILLSQLSGALLTVRAGVTNARALPKAFSLIQESKSDFIGVVLNGVHLNDNPYYSKYYHKS